MRNLVVSEVFGPVWQGEGPSAGQRCGFIRLGRCNLNCSWCDTPYTWDWNGENGTVYDPAAELSERSVDEVIAELEEMAVERIVVSGGEPLIQATGLEALAWAAHDRGWEVEVETNGTRRPGSLAAIVDQWNVSPKLSGSGVDKDRAIKAHALTDFVAAGAAFKFVVCDEAELAEVDYLVEWLKLENVWIMPEGRHTVELLDRARALVPAIAERGYHLTLRQQVLLYGDRRGV